MVQVKHPTILAPIRWLALLAGMFVLAVSPSQANERVISDIDDRVALFGYDPVAYFLDEEAQEGLDAFELIHRRLVWRFANEGNMQRFIADPNTFLPAYGGHGAWAVARGAATPGHPEIWIRLGDRVFLFRDAAARYAFLLEAERAVAAADAVWPTLRETLVP